MGWIINSCMTKAFGLNNTTAGLSHTDRGRWLPQPTNTVTNRAIKAAGRSVLTRRWKTVLQRRNVKLQLPAAHK